MGEVLITGVRSEEVAALMPLFRDELQSALDQGSNLYTIEYLQQKCERQDKQLWAAFVGSDAVAVVITAICEYPQERVLELQFCGGERLQEWLHKMMPVLESYAEENQCDSVIIVGRRGWKKALPDYTPTQTVFRKVI